MSLLLPLPNLMLPLPLPMMPMPFYFRIVNARNVSSSHEETRGFVQNGIAAYGQGQWRQEQCATPNGIVEGSNRGSGGTSKDNPRTI